MSRPQGSPIQLPDAFEGDLWCKPLGGWLERLFLGATEAAIVLACLSQVVTVVPERWPALLVIQLGSLLSALAFVVLARWARTRRRRSFYRYRAASPAGFGGQAAVGGELVRRP